MNTPLVSVICLSYNHAPYIRESVTSILEQTYPDVELILVDDASTDGSGEVMRQVHSENHGSKLIINEKNLGNCKAFNIGFAMSRGEFIIDLAADDVLLPERIREGVRCFSEQGDDYGINFTDAAFIDKDSEITGHHYQRDGNGRLIDVVPEGDVFREVLGRYFICGPTVMMRRKVLEDLGGYDESLDYEDFDLWVRASRTWKFCYSDQILVHRRILPGSKARRQYKKGDTQVFSTLKVCQKAMELSKSREEKKALGKRLRYEMRVSLQNGQLKAANGFFNLLMKL